MKKTQHNYNISGASSEDFWDVYQLYKGLTESEPLFSENNYKNYIADKTKNISIVRDNNGNSMGLVAWIVWPGALSFPLDICFIQDMIVLEEHRKKGVGSFMLEHVKQWALSNKINIMHLQTDNTEAVDFYKRNGFESRNTGLFSFIQ